VLQQFADLTPAQRVERYYTAVTAETCRRSLRKFVRTSWPLIDPAPFVPAWHIDALCDHLAFVVLGDIRNLMIMVPPRSSKSSIVSVAFPAWVWADHPEEQFLCASYAADLAKIDAAKNRRLVESEWYQSRYPDVMILSDENRVDRFSTTAGGYRTTISVGSKTTGLGGNYLCLPGDELVWTDRGLLPIGKIVHERIRALALSIDESTGAASYQRITAFHQNPGRKIIAVECDDGSAVHCTGDHRLLTLNRGWVEAQQLRPSDVLPGAPLPDHRNRAVTYPELVAQNTVAFTRSHECDDLRLCELDAATLVENPGIALQPYMARDSLPRIACSNPIDGGWFDPITTREYCCALGTCSDLDRLGLGQLRAWPKFIAGERSVPLGVVDVLSARAIAKIRQVVSRTVSVAMPDLASGWRLAYKGVHHDLMHEQVMRATVLPGVEPRIASTVIWRSKDSPFNTPTTANRGGSCNSFLGTNASEIRHAVKPIKSRNRKPTLIRSLGHTNQTYCITVERNHNFFAGERGVLVANCLDDPHNAAEVEHEAARKAVISWHDGAWRSRVNNPNTARRIYVAQATHAQDVLHHVLDKEEKRWVVLRLAMEYDGSRKCITYRNRGKGPEGEPIFRDPREKPGSLLCPSRYDEDTIEAIRDAISDRVYQAQYQQNPQGAGGKIWKLKWWRKWAWPKWHLEYRKSERPLPEFIEVIQAYDTAFEEGEQDSFSVRTTWGLFLNQDLIEGNKGRIGYGPERVNALLLERKKWRPGFGELRDEAIEAGQLWEPDRILVEKKASGHSLVKELRAKKLPVRAVKIQGDLVYRAHMASLPLEKGSIWYVDRPWAKSFIDVCAKFPDVDFDDEIASAAIALQYMRKHMDLELEDDDDNEDDLSLFDPKIARRSSFYG